MLNIKPISFTNEVLKVDKSIDFKELQPLNIDHIFVTNEVLKFEKLIDSNE